MPTLSTSQMLVKTDDSLRTAGLRFVNSGEESLGTAKTTYLTAVRDAMKHSLEADERAVVFGEDVSFGGVFRCSMGLLDQFGPDRVFNTPLCEQGIAGFAIGMAAMGHRTIAEIQFADYILPAFDQICNEAAKYRYRSGGMFDVGNLTIRAPCMGVGHGALYHSQSVEGFFQHAAGIKCVIPRSPIQAKGLLRAAVLDPNPVLVLEPKILYRALQENVPVGDYTLPLDKAEVVREGTDLTIVSWGTPLYVVEQALHMLRHPAPELAPLVPESLRNLSVELIDLRTVAPYDFETVAQSVNKTGRLIVVHEASKTGGVGAEVCADITQRCFFRLESPVRRITGWDTPFPAQFETFFLPTAVRVLDGIIETMSA